MPLAAFKRQAGTTNMALAGYYIADRRPRSGARRPRQYKQLAQDPGATPPTPGSSAIGTHGVHGDGVSVTQLWAADGRRPVDRDGRTRLDRIDS